MMEDLSSEELQQKGCLVKQYAHIKEEMSRSDAVDIVNNLFQGGHVVSHVQERITHDLSSRRQSVELLMKYVISGNPSTISAFMTSLQGPLEFLRKRIDETELSEEEMEKIKMLEQISHGEIRGKKRIKNHKFCLTYKAEKFLSSQLFDIEIVDQLNDYMLSDLYISVGDHSKIVNAVTVTDKVQLLLDVMKECSESVQSVLDKVLKKNKLEHVLEGLKNSTTRHKYKRSSAATEGHSTKQSQKDMLEKRVVSTVNSTKGKDRLSAQSDRLFGKKFHRAYQKCIVLQFEHNEGDSLDDLKRVCNTERNIKEFVQGVFEGTGIENILGEGDFKWNHSMLLMQVNQPNLESLARGSPKDDVWNIFVEELDPRRLCKDLKQEGLLDESDEAEMLEKTSRIDRMRFLLVKLTAMPNGYKVLMAHCTMYNKYVIQKLEENEITMSLRNHMNTVSSQADAQNNSDLEVLYTATLVMKIKEKEQTTYRKSETKEQTVYRGSVTSEEYEITFSHILDPVYYFDDVLKNRATTPQKDLFMVLQSPFEEEENMSFFKTADEKEKAADLQKDNAMVLEPLDDPAVADGADEEDSDTDLKKGDVMVLEQVVEPLNERVFVNGGDEKENGVDLPKEDVIVLEHSVETLNESAVADGADEKENGAHLPKEDVMVLEHSVEVLNDTAVADQSNKRMQKQLLKKYGFLEEVLNWPDIILIASNLYTNGYLQKHKLKKIRNRSQPRRRAIDILLNVVLRNTSSVSAFMMIIESKSTLSYIAERINMTQISAEEMESVQDHTGLYQCSGGHPKWEPEDNLWIEHSRWYPECPHVQKGMICQYHARKKDRTGVQDHTGLYQCGGVLQKWEPEDNPCIEHSTWYPECPHVQNEWTRIFPILLAEGTAHLQSYISPFNTDCAKTNDKAPSLHCQLQNLSVIEGS